jgi:hypothetical protein
MQEYPKSLKPDRIFKSILSAFFVAIGGCIAIASVVATLKLFIVQRGISRSADHFNANQPSAALNRLASIQKLALRYPSVAEAASCEIVRAHFRCGDFAAAEQQADWIMGYSIDGSVPSPTVSFCGFMPFLRTAPDCLLNKMSEVSRGKKYVWHRTSGYSVIFNELTAEGDNALAKLESFAKSVLMKDPENTEARAILANLTDNRWRTTRRRSPTPILGETPEPVPSEPEVTDSDPVPLRVDRDRRLSELKAREQMLLDSIEARKSASTPANPHEDGYNAAVDRYKATQAKGQQLQKQMNESTGQARMNAMDELRKMKGDVSRQEAQLADLKAKKNAWDRSHPSNAANDPTVKRLQDELLQVRQEIQSL